MQIPMEAMLKLAILVPAIVMAVPAVIMARSVLEVRRWNRVQGVVASVGLASMRYKGSPARSLRPVIRYNYTVNGVELTGDVFEYGRRTGGSESWAKAILDRHPPGTPVIVLHDPLKPSRACLRATFGLAEWALSTLSLLLLLLALAI
jgi:hypothetical protein